MASLRKIGAAYLVLVAVAVGVFFIINPFLVDSFDVMDIWYPLDVLMAIGLAVALVVNFASTLQEGRPDDDGQVTRRYLAVNLAFYLTAAVAILFFHNWFSLLAQGADSLDGNHQAWVIWAFVDVALPLVLAATGIRLWRDASRP